MTKYLPKDYNLKFPKSSGEYTIIKAIGRGASTIAYLTTYTDETISHSERIVKEYYPCNLKIKRCEDGSLICDEKDKQQFKRGKEQFFAGGNRQNELRNKTNLKNEIPPLQGIYEANNTLYLEVTPFEGKTFDRIDNLSLLQKMKICLAVAKLASQYHNLEILCLDIKPENIFVLTNSSSEFVTDMIEFIDFDSVRSKKELTFGNSLSFTESWSAPEQKNPYGYSKISEATDIYTVGELVFWSVFGRHSNSDEHRGFSSYPFEDTELLFFKELTRKQLRILLTRLFHNTLRSSVRNRFTRMNEVIVLLEKAVEELEKQEKINNFEIRLKDCFVGREKELEEIDQALKKNDIVFVSGIAGIGKSELVKQYICHHKNEFDNILYWIYEENLETMVCNETSVSIANFSRLPKENDTAYCKRKLEEIKTLLTGDNLIVIDNVEDVLVEEFQHQEVWQGIQAIRGKILVSTRCKEKNYKQVEIHEIKNIESVKEIFYRYCPSARNIPEQIRFVEDIISIANYHTYEIELLAAYTEAKIQSPKDTLCEMKAYGFDKTEFSVLKDGKSPSATYKEHLTKLFSMAQMSELQKKLMIKISCLPVTGICAKEFFFYYSIENKNDLNWLINHGFVNVTSDTEHILSVHPSVSNVIIEIVKNDNQLLEDFFEDSFIAMRKGYDDESINQGYFEEVCRSINDVTIKGKLDSDVESAKDSVRKEYELKYSKSQVSQTEYLQMCDSIVDKVTAHGVCCIAAAKFITQYVEWFAKYGRNTRNRNLIEYAVEVYDKKGTCQYMPDREYAYAVYAEILLNSKKYSETVDLCEKHLMLARKAKDWSMASYWSIDLAQAYFELREISGSLFQVKSYYYMFRRAIQRNSTQNCWGNTFSRSMNKYSLRLAEVIENMYGTYPPSDSRFSIWSLKNAIQLRKKEMQDNREMIPSDNSVKIAIDEARIYMLQHQYTEAKLQLLFSLASYQNAHLQFAVGTLTACELLGDIYLVIENYSSAEEMYREALKMAQQLCYFDDYPIKVKLGRILNLAEKIDESSKYNLSILQELENVNREDERHILADAYYNVGDLYFLKKDYSVAWEHFELAASIYESTTRLRLHNNIGKARCYERFARISFQRNQMKEAVSYIEKGVKQLEEMLGAEHPEVNSFKKLLSYYKKEN